ncbi:GATA zinc finger domain-containing protein 14-like [Homalodisca vitripennis]|uniref:GATA zinc finger domain-containing protein 14-like n=1 Tax=Homalodisca vitripennis TaxID=197043 RepID=UPI001EECC0B7|nr:GATA zinc finger domain-containing protein 14-like [Homalodisca vitripennis]XP_046665419.1 GATA zinc finger domain-containing protein 14-like [Homalodisca vitripennis]
MRVSRSNSAAAAASLLVWLVPLVSSISVPSGKLTPITPAKPTPRYVNPHAPAQPAAVVEYSQDHPEPPPLDPSYVPVRYDYFDTLAKHHVYYVPLRFPNFNGVSNHIDYEPRQKFYGQTLGKNIGYKPFKQQLYFPARQSDWNQQNNYVNNQDNQVKDQYNQNNGQYNQYNNQANNQVSNNNQYSRSTNEYNNQNNNQYNVQPTQQQQHEVFSTQAAPASSVLPQALSSTPQALSSTPQAQTQNPTQTYSKVDYSSGKGSYDVTGKGGSRSEYYGLTKEDWSKKSVYPKKVVGQGLTPRKFGSHKY